MLRLLVLRHSKTERGAIGGDDHARRLEARGRADAPAIGTYMAKHRLLPDLAIVSSAARTRETWDLVAAVLPSAPAEHIEDDLYNASPLDILRVVQQAPASAQVVAIVGHNPGFHDVSVWLSGSGDEDASQRLLMGLPTSGLVVIDFDITRWADLAPGTGRIERFVTPESLATVKR